LNEIYKLLISKEIDSFMWDIVKLSNHIIGSPANVEFDWELVMKQEEEYGNVIGFFHTHPFCSQFSVDVAYSNIDYNTMCGWVDCFGKPLYCMIGRGEEDTNPTIHVFAPKNKIVLCQGSILGYDKNQKDDWVVENKYYKGSLAYDKSLYIDNNTLRLPYLCCV